MTPETLASLKIILQEKNYPYFTDEQLNFYYGRNENNLELTAYRCLLIKAEDTSLKISGLTTGDTSKYFRRQAAQYRPNHSGILRGV